MTLIKWTPLKELTSLRERMNQLMDDPFLKFPFEFERSAEVDWVPAVDIIEKDNAVVLKTELPGMDLKDIDIHVEANTLQIKGTRALERDEQKEKYRRTERVYGSFKRNFTIPDSVDANQIGATYEKGVLNITLPKKQEEKPKKIKVEIKS